MRARADAPVVFVLPPGGLVPYFSEHLGTAFLRAVLARAGIAARAYLPRRNTSLAEFATFLRETRPRVVGLTAYETNLRACAALAGVVRETLPEAVLAVGGPNATFTPEETLDLLGADLCLRGAAEASVVALASAVLGAERPRARLAGLLARVPGLVVRTRGGVARTPPGDLSSFPGPPYGTLDDLPSPYQDGVVETGEIGLLTARGCNQHCTYCSFAAISARRVQYHGVERVLADLAALKRLRASVPLRHRSVTIFDDAFTLAPERARAICEGMIARGLELPLDCETRADRVDLPLLRLMKRAGFVRIAFGLESAVPRVLRAAGKVQDPLTRDDPGLEGERAFVARARTAVAEARRAGLEPTVSIIGGLPGETASDLRTTLAFVRSLGVSAYSHNVLSVFPGTPLHRDRAGAGLDAGRDPASGEWRTSHAYDVRAVPHLRSSVTHAQRWEEASQIADALCGRDRPARADGGPWAVVIHADAPDPGTAEWLARILPVHGAVVAVSTTRGRDGADRDRWARALERARVPFGLLAVLSRERGPRGTTHLRSVGPSGSHRFALRTAWRPREHRIEVGETGHCRVPVWLASDPGAAPPGAAPEDRWTPQIADGCRWWGGFRRCRRPRVLHVAPDLTVRPCWSGPALGEVGDALEDVLARAAALGGPGAAPSADRCPLDAGGVRERTAEATRQLEVVSQASFVLQWRARRA